MFANGLGFVSLTVNSKLVSVKKIEKGDVKILRKWEKGDFIELDLPMRVRRVHSHSNVESDRGRVALMRGPIVYCLEELDNPDYFTRHRVFLPENAVLEEEYRRDFLGGVVTIKGRGLRMEVEGRTRDVKLIAVPYYSWNNRKLCRMAVWIQENPESHII